MTSVQPNFSLPPANGPAMAPLDDSKDENLYVQENRPVTPPPALPKNALFPLRLHSMLDVVERNGDDHIVSWLSDEKSFKVHDIDEFIAVILPQFFQQTKYKSFQRQLNMWGFVRILEGPASGGYSHDLFVRGQEDLCKQMKRIKIKGSPEKRLKPIRCQNTRIFPPPMSSVLKSVSKSSSKPAIVSPIAKTQKRRNGSMAFLAASAPFLSKDLFGSRDDILDSIESAEPPLYTSYDLDVDILSLEPLALDDHEIETTDFELLGDLTTLLD